MKKSFFICFLFFSGFYAIGQNGTPLSAKEILTRKDDVDFTVVSKDNVVTEFRYYLVKDTLYYRMGAARYQIPVKDINFKESDDFTDSSWHSTAGEFAQRLFIELNGGSTLSKWETPGSKEEGTRFADLIFPTKELAKDMYWRLKNIAEGVNPDAKTSDNDLLDGISTEPALCDGVKAYIAELEKGQFQKYLGEIRYTGEYVSKLKFPGAKKAIIYNADKAGSSRSAKIILSSGEYEQDDVKTEYGIHSLVDSYKELVDLCMFTLYRRDFEKKDLGSNTAIKRMVNTVFTHKLAGGKSIIIELYAEKNKKDGKFVYDVCLFFKKE